MEATWTQDGSRLAYRVDDELIVHPTAREIWAAEFAGSRLVCGKQIHASPSSDLPHLTISRVPAQVSLHVSGNSIQGLQLELVADMQSAQEPLTLSTGTVGDQIISDDCWFPIDADAIHTSLAELRLRGIQVPSKINLGQLVLLKSLPLDLGIIDEAETDPAAALRSARPLDASVDGVFAQLYDYQTDGIAFLRLISQQGLGCILGDEMGLGKTLQVIALLQAEKNVGRTPNLVIVPATLLENWRRELATFAPQLSVLIHSGSVRGGVKERLSPFDVVITSYDTAVRDEPLLASIRWNVVALDEAQNIRNPLAIRSESVKRLDRRISIAVTGTPVENRLSDLWSIANFVLPDLLGSLAEFESTFDDSPDDASRLAPVVAPILLRRRVADVASDLPPRIDVPQPILMTADMATAYEQVRSETQAEYTSGAGLVALQRLRMFCAHPHLLDHLLAMPRDEMPKYRRLLEILDEIVEAGEKALIFSTYNEIANYFIEDFGRRYRQSFFKAINGRVPVPDRQLIVDAFTEHRGSGALVLNPKAAGVGLNITAATHVIHYNPEWNPAVEDQATARAYRRKQTRPVTVHHLYFADSLEDVMMDRLGFKRTLAREAVTGHAGDTSAADLRRALDISPISRRDALE